MAWAYATSRDPKIQDFPKARQYAIESNKYSNGESFAIIDTLATAYAANGDFVKAVEWEEKAIKLFKSIGENSYLEELKYRLDLFKRERTYVEE